jgi:hypothetical protein
MEFKELMELQVEMQIVIGHGVVTHLLLVLMQMQEHMVPRDKMVNTVKQQLQQPLILEN